MFNDNRDGGRGHYVTPINDFFVRARCGVVLNSRFLQYARESEQCAGCQRPAARHS
jgi:hypothetical protein